MRIHPWGAEPRADRASKKQPARGVWEPQLGGKVEPGKFDETAGALPPYLYVGGYMDGKPDFADVYCDGVNIAMTPYDALLILDRKELLPIKEDGKVEMKANRVGVVRMSLEHAKVLAILLRKNLLEHETKMGTPIPMHPELMQKLGISKLEDW